ncbi:MAG: hypothetical protein EH225_05430 [Calditrichaeota bacterium]|nr:protein kinase [Calditrichota bacterium]RQW04753.1 MAG: hypothetical protein EH225_05430 [Calditrichota bacterium]
MTRNNILHYNVIQKLGEGGMGVLCLAEDIRLRRKIASKFLPQPVAVDEDAGERFKIEAQAAAALNLPNISQIYAIEEVNEEIFIIMEHIEGRKLKNIVKEIPQDKISSAFDKRSFPSFLKRGDVGLKLNDVLNIAIQIAEGFSDINIPSSHRNSW